MTNNSASSPVDALFLEVYDSVHRISSQRMAEERVGHTLQTTALVNEAWLRLRCSHNLNDADYDLFIAAAAKAIRRILVDHARKANAQKHGGGYSRIELDTVEQFEHRGPIDPLVLDEALTRLEAVNPRGSAMIELVYYAGETIVGAAKVLRITPDQAQDSFTKARNWLKDALK